MSNQQQQSPAELFDIKQIPARVTKNKHGSSADSYYVTVKNKRTGYTKLMARDKAYRYLNNRPSLWKWVSPIFSFKDEYEIVGC